MAKLKGIIRDEASGARVPAKVHVLTSSGRFIHPADSILKVGPGDPFFYCDGEFELSVARGAVDIIVERGTEYEPARVVVVPARQRLGGRGDPDQAVVLPAGGQLVPRQHPHPLR